jgi:hypothetical protein
MYYTRMTVQRLSASFPKGPQFQPSTQKNIISTGNSKSDLYVVANVAKMEAAADCNGTVIQNTYIDPTFGRAFLLNHISTLYQIPYALLEPSEARLLATPFQKFRVVFLRANIAEPGTTWLMDNAQRDIFVANCTSIAKLAYRGGVIGVMIDNEAYNGSDFWRYDDLAIQYPSAYTFADYQQRYYEVGVLVGQGMTSEYARIKIALQISFEQLRSIPAGSLPANKYGLLPSFLNGLFDGVGRDVRIINTMEDGYANRVAADFDYDVDIQRPANVPYLTSLNYPAAHLYGMSTWCDYPGTGFNFNQVDLNYNTPGGFYNNLNLSLERVDWVISYGEQLNWQDPRIGVSAPPAEYRDSLTRAARLWRVII